MTRFWQTWLLCWCVGVLAFGVIMMSASIETGSAPVRLLYEILLQPLPTPMSSHLRFANGLMGAVVIGWGTTVLILVRHSVRVERSMATIIWRSLMSGLSIWFVADSTISLLNGFWPNAIINLVFFILFVIPVLRCSLLKRIALHDHRTGGTEPSI
jgi:hypothetical protein